MTKLCNSAQSLLSPILHVKTEVQKDNIPKIKSVDMYITPLLIFLFEHIHTCKWTHCSSQDILKPLVGWYRACKTLSQALNASSSGKTRQLSLITVSRRRWCCD